MAMMISQISIEDRIAEAEEIIQYVIESILATAPNRENMLFGLKDLRYFEDDLQKLRELKK